MDCYTRILLVLLRNDSSSSSSTWLFSILNLIQCSVKKPRLAQAKGRGNGDYRWALVHK